MFENCPFTLIFQAFKEIWPDIKVRVAWTPAEMMDGAKGSCGWGEDGIAFVQINASLPIAGACDILCHELAHAAVSQYEVHRGPDYHSPEWKSAYVALVERYVELLKEDDSSEIVHAELVAA